MKHTLLLVVGGSVIATSLVWGVTAFAQTAPTVSVNVGASAHAGFTGPGSNGGARVPVIAGTVSAESGDTLTVTSQAFGQGFGRPNATTTGSMKTGTTTVYTVDATNATVMKNGTSSTLSAVSVGDTVFVQGTISGTSVTATAIRDGVVPGMMGRGGMRGMGGANGTSTMMMHGSGTTSIIQGNGQPVVGGNVTAISGDTLTVTTAKDSVVYTVDATSATVVKGGATSTIGSVAVGDNVLVQGSVSGTSVTASSVIDQGVARTATSTSSSSTSTKGFGGFMGAIGGIFHRIFGFF